MPVALYLLDLSESGPGTSAATTATPRPTISAPAIAPIPEPTSTSTPTTGQTRTFDLGGGVTMEFVWCPPGSFMMGSPWGEQDNYTDESPQHTLTFSEGFWMGKYEVTQAQWEGVMGNNPSGVKSANLPVDQVSWQDCRLFITKVNSQTTGGFSLPTEAAWEYACRAGTTTVFSFGDSKGDLYRFGNYRDASNTVGFGWQDKNHNDGHDRTAPVGSFLPNAWGLYDMHGNVWEWCSSQYMPYPYNPGDGRENLIGNDARILRGGSWYVTASLCVRRTAIFTLRTTGTTTTGFVLSQFPRLARHQIKCPHPHSPRRRRNLQHSPSFHPRRRRNLQHPPPFRPRRHPAKSAHSTLAVAS